MDQTEMKMIRRTRKLSCPETGDEEKVKQKNGLQEECEGDKSDSEEDVKVNYLRSNVERAEAEIIQKTKSKVKKGGKYIIKNIGEHMTRRVEILSQSGKATEKYQHVYSVHDLNDVSLN